MSIYHIAVESDWAAAQASGEYRMSTRESPFDDVGFIHASFAHQVERTGALIYGDASVRLVVLEIDPTRLKSPVKVENLDGGTDQFPHIYGPLPTSAVVEVLPVVVQEGRFIVEGLTPEA